MCGEPWKAACGTHRRADHAVQMSSIAPTMKRFKPPAATRRLARANAGSLSVRGTTERESGSEHVRHAQLGGAGPSRRAPLRLRRK